MAAMDASAAQRQSESGLHRPHSAFEKTSILQSQVSSAWGGSDLTHSVDTLQLAPQVGRSVYLSRGIRQRTVQNDRTLPAGHSVTQREGIWDAVHHMYRVVGRATADPASKDEHVHFTGPLRSSHRLPSSASSFVGLGAPSQLTTGDIVIADMHTEIKALQAKLEAKRNAHKQNLQKIAKQKWNSENRVRQAEKINAFLRQVVMTEELEPTGSDGTDHRAVSISTKGPETRTNLLHESIELVSQAVREGARSVFTRVIPPCPDPVLEPLSTAMPIQIWVLFVKEYDHIHHEYKYKDRNKARRALAEVKQCAERTLIKLRDRDIDDTKCVLDLMRVLVSSRHIGRLRQLDFHDEHLVIINDSASIKNFSEAVHIEDLLRHGDKKLPLMFAQVPRGIQVPSATSYLANQVAEKVVKGPLKFKDTVMSADFNWSIKVKSHHHVESSRSGSTTQLLARAGTCFAGSVQHVGSTSIALDNEPTDVTSSEPEHELNQTSHVDPLNESREAAADSWLLTFEHLLTSYNHVRSEKEDAEKLGTRTEMIKRRTVVYRSVKKLLAGLLAEDLFHDAVDALDQKTRSDMLEEVAAEFSVLGLQMRTLQSMSKMNESGLDLEGSCESFLCEVKVLLKAQHVRLWMVDQKNGQIWEWFGNEQHPRKRSVFPPASDMAHMGSFAKRKFVRKTGIAADVARTGVAINVPFPAVQCPSFSIEIDRLPGENALTILCEPLRYRGEVMAVVQCYNKQSNDEGDSSREPEPFTCVDEQVLRMLGENMAELIHKCRNFQDVMTASDRTLHGTGLTWHYPCSPSDLFHLAQSYLLYIRDHFQAEHCVLYVLSVNAISGEKKLWTNSPEGTSARRNAELGQGLAGWVVDKEESLNVDDLSTESRYNPTVDAAFTDPASSNGDPRPDFVGRNALAVPLKNHDGTMLGVCVMLNKETGSFSDFDEQLLRLECQHVVLMVKTSTANFSYFATQETIPETLHRCMQLVECERTHFFVCDTVERKDNTMHVLHLFASSDDYMSDRTHQVNENPPVDIPVSDGILGYVVRARKTIVIPNARDDPRFNLKIDDMMGYRTTSLMAIPVIDSKKTSGTMGALFIANKHANGLNGAG